MMAANVPTRRPDRWQKSRDQAAHTTPNAKHESICRIPEGLIDDRFRMHKAVSGLLRKSLCDSLQMVT